VLLVNRGWVPEDRRDPATRPDGQLAGSVVVEGLLRAPAHRGMFMPANDPAAGDWYRIDPAAMAAHLGLDDARPYFLEADRIALPGGLPVGGHPVIDTTNRHLIFAIAWFGLAVSAVAVYVAYLRGILAPPAKKP
jgi:surfeit locus 1 family protein